MRIQNKRQTIKFVRIQYLRIQYMRQTIEGIIIQYMRQTADESLIQKAGISEVCFTEGGHIAVFQSIKAANPLKA